MIMQTSNLAPGRAGVANAGRLVIKLGTATLTHQDGALAHARFHALVDSLVALHRAGRELVLVTSGAVGLGGARLRAMPEGAGELRRQTRAAVGQARLMALYADAFGQQGVTTAQLLVTGADLSQRERAAELRATLRELIACDVVPIVNANDALNVPGAHSVVAENDHVAARVAGYVDADLLLLLTDVDGLYDGDPRGVETPQLLGLVPDVTPAIAAAAGSTGRGTGGMRTKLDAARLASRAGCMVVIANGAEPRVIDRVTGGEGLGTLFPARPRRVSAEFRSAQQQAG